MLWADLLLRSFVHVLFSLFWLGLLAGAAPSMGIAFSSDACLNTKWERQRLSHCITPVSMNGEEGVLTHSHTRLIQTAVLTNDAIFFTMLRHQSCRLPLSDVDHRSVTHGWMALVFRCRRTPHPQAWCVPQLRPHSLIRGLRARIIRGANSKGTAF